MHARRMSEIPDYDICDWHDVIETDLTGVFFCLKYEIPAILSSGGGAIVNMSSGMALLVWPDSLPTRLPNMALLA